MTSRIAIDLTALRRSRDFRVLALGQLVSGLGSQAALVAVPIQVFTLTHSAGLLGLIGAAELGPIVVVSLIGGAWADRVDRRRLVVCAQLVTITSVAALAALALAGRPPVVLVFVLAGVLAGSAALDQLSRSSMVPALAGEWLRSALAFNFGMTQLTGIVGPSLGGILVALGGVGTVYVADAISCVPLILVTLTLAPQRPHDVAEHPSVLSSIREGLRFVRRSNALLGSFVIDLMAMAFGMPRVLFVVLALTVYHAGDAGTGFLYASVAAGATIAAFTTGWLEHARRLGRIVIGAVLVWGGAIACAGAVHSIWIAAPLLACAGAADSVSAVCRSTINQIVTPDEMRGRMSAVFGLVVTSGPRLGDVESGTVAALGGAQLSVVSGGLACVAGVGLVLLAFPSLVAYDSAAA